MFQAYTVNYLFDSTGKWIAFRKGIHVFDTRGRWIGYTPWKDNDVYTPSGEYLATIMQSNRLYYENNHTNRGLPDRVAMPRFPGVFPVPPYPGRAPLPQRATDVDLSQLNNADANVS